MNSELRKLLGQAWNVDSVRNFKYEGSLYIPYYLTRENKKLLLRDYGLGSSISGKSLFGKFINISEIKELLTKYEFSSLLTLSTKLANYLNRKGHGTIEKDSLQKDILREAIQEAMVFGWSTTRQPEITKEAAISIHTVHALTACCLSLGQTEKGVVIADRDLQSLSLALILLNDHIIPVDDSVDVKSLEYQYLNMKDFWFRGPHYGARATYLRRMFRFTRITKETFAELNLKEKEFFEKYYGFNFDDFCKFIPAINTAWLGNDKLNQLPLLICTPPNRASHLLLNQLLCKLSLPIPQYQKDIKELEKSDGDNFLKSHRLIAKLVERPFLEVEPNVYLCLGGDLLLRQRWPDFLGQDLGSA